MSQEIIICESCDIISYTDDWRSCTCSVYICKECMAEYDKEHYDK